MPAACCARFPPECTYPNTTSMAVHEWIVAGYFGALALVAWLFPVPRRQRVLATAASIAVLTIVVLLSGRWPHVRAWIPHVYLVAGYWIPALLVQRVKDSRFERWLVWSETALRRSLPVVKAPLAPVVELAYLLCYALIPVAFALVWESGRAVEVERFWTAVLVAGYSCYATLPWLVSEPPRLSAGHARIHGRIATLNAYVLGRVSHRMNTFPSGHVAVTAAAAASVASISTAASVGLLVVVAGIAVGAASGRYHYVIDVLLGLVVAAVAVVGARIG